MIYYTTNLPKKISIESLDEAIVFASKYLGINDEVLLNISFTSSIHPVFGFYEGLDDDEYQITINSKISYEDIVETLFHELVHLSQHIRGDFDQDMRMWKGKRYDSSYLDLPWEKEAFYHQEIMMEGYRNNEKGITWNLHPNGMTLVTSGLGPL